MINAGLAYYNKKEYRMKPMSSQGDAFSHPVFNILATLLKELLELGCSLPEIAAQTQISLRTLRRLYRGETAQPSRQTFSRILSFYCHHTSKLPHLMEKDVA